VGRPLGELITGSKGIDLSSEDAHEEPGQSFHTPDAGGGRRGLLDGVRPERGAARKPMARLRPLTRSRARTVLLLVVAKVFPPNSVQMRQLAVGEVPRRGTNDEVLSAHRLDAASVVERVQAELGVRA
jgi:hypothetical protein